MTDQCPHMVCKLLVFGKSEHIKEPVLPKPKSEKPTEDWPVIADGPVPPTKPSLDALVDEAVAREALSAAEKQRRYREKHAEAVRERDRERKRRKRGG